MEIKLKATPMESIGKHRETQGKLENAAKTLEHRRKSWNTHSKHWKTQEQNTQQAENIRTYSKTQRKPIRIYKTSGKL